MTHFSCKRNYSILLHNKTPIYSAWGLLRACAACPTPRLNQSYELRPPWEQHLRYVPLRVRNGYDRVSKRGEKSDLPSSYIKNCKQTVPAAETMKAPLPGTQCIFMPCMALTRITFDIDIRTATET